MAQTNLTIRIDENIKHDAGVLFDNLGFSLSGVINVFFRQAIREQAIPFQIKSKTSEEKYNEYFNSDNIKRLMHSTEQVNQGEVITFSIEELEAMENGYIPQRGIDFLNKHKGNLAE